MAKQIRTPAEQTQVDDDFDTFLFPFDLSINARGNTVYGTTDPTINLSMVNVRHLNDTRMFRGTWVASPVDGDPSDTVADEPVPYTAGQVVIDPGDHLFYMLTGTPGMDPPRMDTGALGNWRLLGQQDRLATELTTAPESIQLPLFAGNQNVAFTVNEPAPYSFVENPIVMATPGLNAAPLVSSGARVTATVPNQTSADDSVIFTSQGRLNLPNDETSLPSTVDTPVTFSDQRTEPLITLASRSSSRISRIRINPTDPLPVSTYDVELTPGSTSVSAGTAYAVRWTGTVGTSASTSNAASGQYSTPTGLLNNADLVFSFTLNTASNPNSQTGVPMDQTFPIRVYSPWFWTFSSSAPTSVASMTEALINGDTQGDDFPVMDGSTISITGNTNTIQTLWLAVPSSVDRKITLNTGVAFAQSNTDGTINATNVAGAAVQYTLHRFRLGLVQSPTTFTIMSLPNTN